MLAEAGGRAEMRWTERDVQSGLMRVGLRKRTHAHVGLMRHRSAGIEDCFGQGILSCLQGALAWPGQSWKGISLCPLSRYNLLHV